MPKLTPAQDATLERMKRIAPVGAWVHASLLSRYRGANVMSVRALVAAGLLAERPAEGYPGFAVKLVQTAS